MQAGFLSADLLLLCVCKHLCLQLLAKTLQGLEALLCIGLLLPELVGNLPASPFHPAAQCQRWMWQKQPARGKEASRFAAIKYFKGTPMQGLIEACTWSRPRRPTSMDPATRGHEPHAGKVCGSQGVVQHMASLSSIGDTRCRGHSVSFASWQIASACHASHCLDGMSNLTLTGDPADYSGPAGGTLVQRRATVTPFIAVIQNIKLAVPVCNTRP